MAEKRLKHQNIQKHQKSKK